jgi:hypothetical protein
VTNFPFPISLSQWQPLRKAPHPPFVEFMLFVKANFPCIRTGVLDQHANDFHHAVKGRSRNNNSCDLVGVVLSHDLHLYELHGPNFGGDLEAYGEHYELPLQAIIRSYWTAYAEHLGITGTFHSLDEWAQAVLNARGRKKAA